VHTLLGKSREKSTFLAVKFDRTAVRYDWYIFMDRSVLLSRDVEYLFLWNSDSRVRKFSIPD